MTTKREARKQRAAEHREIQERRRRQRAWKSRALIAVGALTLLTAAAFMASRRDNEENKGRVWSAAHGHWHDK